MRLLVVLLAGLSVFAVVGCGDDDDVETTQMTLVGELDGRSVTDLGGRGPSGGDIYSFSNELKDESGKNVGDLEGISIAIPESGEGERRSSTFQIALAGGTIVVAGIYETAQRAARAPTSEGITNAITGGTGDYRNAGGEVTITPDGSGNLEYKLEIDTP